MDVEASIVNMGNVVVLKIEDFLCVFNDGRGIRRKEEFGRLWSTIFSEESTRLRSVEEGFVWRGEKIVRLLQGYILGSLFGWQASSIGVFDIDKVDLHFLGRLDTDNEWRTFASGNNLIWIVNRFQEKTKSTFELMDNCLGKL